MKKGHKSITTYCYHNNKGNNREVTYEDRILQKEYSSFQARGRRKIVVDFSGGTITSDGDGLLLREVEKRSGILNRFTKCFTDHHDQLAQ